MTRRAATRRFGIAGAVLLFGGREVRAQDVVLRSDVRLVLLDVAVKDQRGRFVEGLQQDQFRVLENGAPQKISVFAREDVPATLGLLIDESGSMSNKRHEVLSAAGNLIQASNPQDEIFVLNFNDTVKKGLPPGTLFSSDPDQLRAALFRGVPSGKTALHDAVIEGVEQLELGGKARKALVVISDGGDTTSRHSRAAMLARVESSLATIYTIGLFDSDEKEQSPGLLKKLAEISGGEAYFPREPAEMRAICERIAREIRQRYTVGYTPPENHGVVRHIQVHVAAPGRSGLTARTRTRYRYDEQPSRTESSVRNF